MKVVVIGAPAQLEEWKSIPPATEANTEVIYQTEEGVQPVPAGVDAVLYLYPEQDAATLNWLKQFGGKLCIVNAVIPTTAELGDSLIRINGWTGFLGRKIAEMAITNSKNTEAAGKLMKELGREVEWVTDCVGMITPRIVAGIVNEAWLAMEDEVSTAAEIDIAMKLGTNYPHGPVEWGKQIGLARIYNLLERLSADQKRYTPSSLLKNEALA